MAVCLLRHFILSLDEKLRAKTLRNISLLAKVGMVLKEPESLKLDDGIWFLSKIGVISNLEISR